MAWPYIYNDKYYDLGELGEHEMQITAVPISRWGEPTKLLISKATVFIKIPGFENQTLDVTGKVQKSDFWIREVTKSYMEYLEKDWDVFTG